jgi:LytS/YehU family sensor histidine kinase
VAPQPETGHIRISVRLCAHHVLIAVADNGVGMSAENRDSVLVAAAAQAHGLQILNQQLLLLYGDRSRLRVFSRPRHGTLVAFAIPRRL